MKEQQVSIHILWNYSKLNGISHKDSFFKIYIKETVNINFEQIYDWLYVIFMFQVELSEECDNITEKIENTIENY